MGRVESGSSGERRKFRSEGLSGERDDTVRERAR